MATVRSSIRFRSAPRARSSAGGTAHGTESKKFDQQETEIERLQEAVRQLQVTEQEQRLAYEEFVSKLSVE